MNLRNLLSWRKSAAELDGRATEPATPAPASGDAAAQGTVDNVVAFPTPSGPHEVAGNAPALAAIGTHRSSGVLSAPEYRQFFDENHFGFGRHNGSRHRSHEALDFGRQERITRFQNIAARLMASRQTRLSWLKSESLAVEGISPITSAQLQLACEHVAREIGVLQEQIELASCGSGWIREALTGYEAGFTRGLREALDFDSLIE